VSGAQKDHTMGMQQLLDVLDRLEKAGVPHSISRSRSDAIQITTSTPGRYWEIEVFVDGVIDVEEFSGGNAIREGMGAVERMLEFWSDPPVPQDSTS
jgi:hypothetical protein